MSDWIKWKGGECPVSEDTMVWYELRMGYKSKRPAGQLSWRATGVGNDIVAYCLSEQTAEEAYEDTDRVEQAVPYKFPNLDEKSAPDFLKAAVKIQEERGKEYDKQDGERSIVAAVTAFNAITRRDISEAEGWLLFQIMKDVRLFTSPGFHFDSALDSVSYAALKAEAKQREGEVRLTNET